MKKLFTLAMILSFSAPVFAECTDDEIDQAIQERQISNEHNRLVKEAQMRREEAEEYERLAREKVLELQAIAEKVDA